MNSVGSPSLSWLTGRFDPIGSCLFLLYEKSAVERLFRPGKFEWAHTQGFSAFCELLSRLIIVHFGAFMGLCAFACGSISFELECLVFFVLTLYSKATCGVSCTLRDSHRGSSVGSRENLHTLVIACSHS